MIKINQKVSWVSQAQGSAKEKTGIVLGFIPKGQSLKKICPVVESISTSQKKYDLDISKVDRYLVRIDRVSAKGKELNPYYYAPSAKPLQRANIK